MIAAGPAISAAISRRSSEGGWRAMNMMMAEPLGSMGTHKAFNWINGVQRSEGTLKTPIDPASCSVVGHDPDDGLNAAKLAAAAAPKAVRETTWPRDRELRARVLDQLARAFERSRDKLLEILSLENGKVKGEAAVELDMIPRKLRDSAATALLDGGRAVTPGPTLAEWMRVRRRDGGCNADIGGCASRTEAAAWHV